MLKEPGNLSDLGTDAKQAWTDEVVKLVTQSQGTAFSDHFKLLAADDWEDGVALVDWGGFPKILQNCLGDQRSAKFCDWQIPSGDLGRVYGQDEYLEWRTVRNSDNKLVRVEFTTELAAYWTILAGHHPMTTLRILGRFAGEPLADWREVYGSLDPFAVGVTTEERSSAFDDMMIWNRNDAPVKSPYNNGQKAIAFLSKPVSSLLAAISLFVRAASPMGKVVDGEEVMLSGPEAIAIGGQSAVDCRNSDPTMVGRMIQEVWNGAEIAFDDPVGVYIRNFAHETLIDPEGNTIPEDWVEYQRGSRPTGDVGQERSQRVVIEVPPGLGFVLGDLKNRDTDETLDYGYQLAELVKVACYFRTSLNGVVTTPRIIQTPVELSDCRSSGNCSIWESRYGDFEQNIATVPAGGQLIQDRTGNT